MIKSEDKVKNKNKQKIEQKHKICTWYLDFTEQLLAQASSRGLNKNLK
jgi:hypothetical protein